MGFRLLLGVAWLCAVLPAGLIAQDLSGKITIHAEEQSPGCRLPRNLSVSLGFMWYLCTGFTNPTLH
ncbi:hypothetical protein AOXY_G30247 [Acipenser oxyrinchus oxyrinchus]|uniref:Uncharacterized protein n=1 Tax=Acipenser oxyrinchus oxyrinchus TaxID=40147 RepID=A0AAD8CLS7_ACIOX|nr:hypothetical protein AOXY_G30247 [Acipenser oxyrinchus oxyrinchus]